MSDEATTEKITLTQHWLGTRPYALIEVAPSTEDPSGPSLFLETGGGAEEEPLYLPLMVLTEHRPEGNPVAEMLRRLYPQESDGYYRQAIAAVVREFNPDWLPFVTGDET